MQQFDSEIIYQIYPKSFQDSNGDGIGDLKGIINRMDYIQSLGVTAIWLNPIFQSPQVDNGYDVSNYYHIDPMFGDMEMMEKLIQSAHDHGLKVLFDMVLNHTSDQHRWFQEAIKGPDNPYRDYYIWKDPKPDGKAPNNWGSFMGGSVWDKEPNGEQYYFHLFAKEMPDLNWENPLVRQEMIRIAKFWLEKGIDGLRLDAFIHMDKEPGFPDAPYGEPGESVVIEEYFANLPKIDLYLQEFAESIREDFPDAYLLGEAASADPRRALDYTLPKGQTCDSIVTFRYFPMQPAKGDKHLPKEVQREALDLRKFKQTMAQWQRLVGTVSEPTLYWNNHDLGRAVSRFGDEKHYREESSKMLATLMYLQKGTPVLLYGEEIGMKNLEWDAFPSSVQSNMKKKEEKLFNTGLSKKERQAILSSKHILASRGAMQWDNSVNVGFSSSRPWSGVNTDSAFTVEAQQKQEDSVLAHYKKVLDLKKSDLFMNGSYQMLVAPEKIFAYVRMDDQCKALIICNFQSEEETAFFEELKEPSYRPLLTSGEYTIKEGNITLSPYASVVLEIV